MAYYAFQWEQLSLWSLFNQRAQKKPYSDINTVYKKQAKVKKKSCLNYHKDQWEVLFSLAFGKVTEAEFHSRPGGRARTKKGDLFQHFHEIYKKKKKIQ